MRAVEKLLGFYWWWQTRLLARNRLVRSGRVRLNVPLRVNGEGVVETGNNITLGFRQAPMTGNGSILLQARTPSSRITIGDGCIFSNNVTVIACQEVSIGDSCLIGDQVTIVDSDFHGSEPWRRGEPGITKPVVIGNNVWIGSRCMILRGVSIGDNSVITAGAVVNRSIPANTIVSHQNLVLNDMSPLWDRE